jgi:glucoside 3-dehydrogenase (cytochrome c) hitch-hiker subunit
MNRRELLKYTAVAMGIGSSSSMLLGALSGCDGGDTPQQSSSGAPARPLIAALAELIIPETDTPGAVAAGVPDFIDQIVFQWYTPTERKIFLDGLVAIDAHCQRLYGQGFVNCTRQQQTEALTQFEEQASRYQPPPRDMFDRNDPEDTPFFFKIRELTVFGYYTSEIGATQELRWLPMPGQYLVDYPLSKVGRAWAN